MTAAFTPVRAWKSGSGTGHPGPPRPDVGRGVLAEVAPKLVHLVGREDRAAPLDHGEETTDPGALRQGRRERLAHDLERRHGADTDVPGAAPHEDVSPPVSRHELQVGVGERLVEAFQQEHRLVATDVSRRGVEDRLLVGGDQGEAEHLIERSHLHAEGRGVEAPPHLAVRHRIEAEDRQRERALLGPQAGRGGHDAAEPPLARDPVEVRRGRCFEGRTSAEVLQRAVRRAGRDDDERLHEAASSPAGGDSPGRKRPRKGWPSTSWRSRRPGSFVTINSATTPTVADWMCPA